MESKPLSRLSTPGTHNSSYWLVSKKAECRISINLSIMLRPPLGPSRETSARRAPHAYSSIDTLKVARRTYASRQTFESCMRM